MIKVSDIRPSMLAANSYKLSSNISKELASATGHPNTAKLTSEWQGQ
jgi:hypothetical protein